MTPQWAHLSVENVAKVEEEENPGRLLAPNLERSGG